MTHQSAQDVTPYVAPWSDKAALYLQQCRASKPDCVFKEVCHRECYYETRSDGIPRRKCVSEMQLLKLCPGRHDWETVSATASSEAGQAESPFPSNGSLDPQSSSDSSHQPAPLQPQLGEQWEDFLKYASDLQRQLASATGVALEPEPATPRQRHVEPQPAPRTVLDRLLRREPGVSPGDQKTYAKLWKDYAAFGSIEET